MRQSLGAARATAGQADAYLAPYDQISRNPVVFCHGLDGTATSAVGQTVPAMQPKLARLSDYGFTTAAVSTGNTWGAAAGLADVADGVTWHRASLHGTDDPVVRIGSSMGATNALQSAAANLADTACVVLLEPALDLQWLREQDTVEGIALRASIDTAWGVTYPAALPADASPLDIAADLAAVPVLLFYATDDDISHSYQAFADAHGDTTLVSLGALGHSNAAIAAVDTDVLAGFVQASV